MKPPLSNEQLAAIKDLLLHGEKIAAIKLYRECAGCQLIEAKTEVESIEAVLRKIAPEKFTAPPKSGKGCLIAFILFDLLAVAGVVLWLLLRR
ncbi:MAG: hypothetical protein HZA89_11785 [Verrucomicrobia bacterium]|nr:hypothetical protein [Verrucomicrobiota bacterium]